MKLRIVICAIAALFIFSGASPLWEFTATVASELELPETGRFIATNVFPVNTLVDITNVENGRRVRVIVAKRLNSPGFEIVSREAAELIGMRPGSLSRIVMVQPSDPIAYQRFTEGFNIDIPEYDSGRTEEELLRDVYGDTWPSSGENGGNSQTAQAGGFRGPSYIPDDEWIGQLGELREKIIDWPPTFVEYPPLNGTGTAQNPADETQKPAEIAVVTEQREIIKDPSEFAPVVSREEADKNPNEFAPVVSREEAGKNPSEFAPVVSREETEKGTNDYLFEEQREDVAKDIQERPAENQVTQPPDPGPITPLPDPGPVTPPLITNGQPPVLNPSPPNPPPPPENNIVIPLSDFIPELIIPPAQETIRPPAIADTASSIPLLSYLDRGWYYVQIATVDSLESVDNIVRQIDSRYEPKAYRDSNNRFCILLKPMNQGESAAVLQRFRSIGYSDAFVRRGS